MEASGGGDVSEVTAAYVVGAAREADRTASRLGLGRWRWLTVEGRTANVHLTEPEQETLLLLVRDRSVPAGRLARSWRRRPTPAPMILPATRPPASAGLGATIRCTVLRARPICI